MAIIYSDWVELVRPLPPSLFLSLPLLCLFNWLVVVCITTNVILDTTGNIAIYHAIIVTLSSPTNENGKYVV